LQQSKTLDIPAFTQQLIAQKTVSQKIAHMADLLYQLFQNKKQNLDLKIKQAIESILLSKGQENIEKLAETLRINLRTLERRFLNETGLSPKQFAKIIQFQSSLQQLTLKNYTKLTDIVYENGYADQSHFIKVFKAFTGKTPKTFSIK
jgi:AraC-like DNA-binding protein